MAFGSSQWMYASGEAFTIDQSLKSDGARETGLTRTFGTPTSLTAGTLSFWVKRGIPGSNSNGTYDQKIFTAIGSGGCEGSLWFRSNDELNFYQHDTGCSRAECEIRTAALFRDYSAWYHIVVAINTSDGTAGDRVKIYVNGTRVTAFTTNTTFDSGETVYWNSTAQSQVHYVGGSSSYPCDMYLAEMHYLDGQTLTPTSFGETGDYGEWKPIEVSGLTYGNNGFYLPFKQDYTVEGFSTTLYTGSGGTWPTTTQSVHGVGFQPDLVWTKNRDNAYDHFWYDSVRGAGEYLGSSRTDVAATSNQLTSFNTDGFTVANDGGVATNGDADPIAAWCWDMGGIAQFPHQITPYGNVKLSTAQGKFDVDGDTSSLVFDGTGDYLSLAPSDDWNFGTGDFTIEFWVYYSAQQAGNGIMSCYQDTDNRWNISHGASNDIYFQVQSGGSAVFSQQIGAAQATGSWRHIAIVKTSGNIQAYEDGTAYGSSVSCGTMPDLSETALEIGRHTSSYYLNGYLDEIRISNTARYSGNFSVATTFFARDDNTLLLMHCNGINDATKDFVDYSGIDLNTAGTNSSRVRANTTYGQSVVTYTGSSGPDTVGHGLDSAPEMYIVKNRTAAGNEWWVYHKDLNGGTDPEDYNLRLDTDAAQANYASWNDTAPTSTVFSVGDFRPSNGGWQDNYIAYCFHSVTGYSKFGGYSGSGSSGKVITTGFKPAFVMLKHSNAQDDWYIFDNTRSPTNPVLAFIKPNSTAVEGNIANGINFTDTGFTILDTGSGRNASGGEYIYAAFADKREYAYWLDQSGNNNDWTSNNLTESDISVDSPTNNFATLNPLWNYSATSHDVLSEGNLRVKDTNNYINRAATFSIDSGKWYWEVYCVDASIIITGVVVGIVDVSKGGYDNNSLALMDHKAGYGYQTYGYKVGGQANNQTAYGDSWTNGDLIGVAYDADNGTITFYKNNVTQGQAYSGISTSATYAPFIEEGDGSNNCDLVFNFGQDSSFSGLKTAQGNQDGNDIGDFYYTPPTNYLALCTSNLPDVTITPNEHFDIALYSGNGSTQNITSVGFQPDLTWIKNREQDDNHQVFDVVRGVTKTWSSSGLAAEATNDDTLTHFLTNGFTTGDDVVTNTSGEAYVAWNWKMGGAGGTSHTQGSRDTTVSANQDAGQSVMYWTGAGSGPYTLGHGLSKAPDVFIYKNMHDTSSIYVYHTSLSAPFSKRLLLNETDGEVSSIIVTATSSTLITVPDGGATDSPNRLMGLAFHSVDGYSKFGSYKGNGNADGTFIYLGFRPRYIMIKTISDSDPWLIYDSDRGWRLDANLRNYIIYANNDPAEGEHGGGSTKAEFMANGVKIRNTGNEINKVGDTYIYLAFAETPFKYSEAGQYTSSPV